jgi:hypothetical protein
VEGKVLVDGKPLAHKGSIAFHPDASKGNNSPYTPAGEIKEDGTYQVYTEGKPGAPAGAYKVTIVSASEVESDKPEAVQYYVSRGYSDPERTPLTVEVTESPGEGAYNFKVRAR